MIDSYEESAWGALCLTTDDGSGPLIPRQMEYEAPGVNEDDPPHLTTNDHDVLECSAAGPAPAGLPLLVLPIAAILRRRTDRIRAPAAAQSPPAAPSPRRLNKPYPRGPVVLR
jgi:uncharacterized protein (TIGR03382 family)